MSQVVGLDLSLAMTGLAVVSDRGWAHTERIPTTGGRKDTLHDRFKRLTYIRDEILEFVPDGTTLVVIERQIGRSTASASTHDRSGLWWMVVAGVFSREVPVVAVVTQHVKLYLGVKHNASKPEGTAAAVKRYGKLVDIADDNEADALSLADMGARHLGFGLEVSLPQGSMRVLERIDWP